MITEDSQLPCNKKVNLLQKPDFPDKGRVIPDGVQKMQSHFTIRQVKWTFQ